MESAGERRILAGKYALGRKLGQGGMGSVWVAEHLTLRSQVAIKLIDSHIASEPEALARFLREARSAAALRSPHVVQILDHGVDEGTPYIVMELLDGESLANRLKRLERLSPAEAAQLLTQVARAIGRAHQAGIVHRDLKPDNIFIVRYDEDEIAKVLDFGIAKATDPGLGSSGVGTRTGTLMGTPFYMSPEQAEGAKNIDFRSDIWSLGVIAFECLLGERPFQNDSIGGLVLAICTRPRPIPSQRGQVPTGFDEWFARSCSRDPERRFQSAKEQATELRRICGTEQLPPPPEVISTEHRSPRSEPPVAPKPESHLANPRLHHLQSVAPKPESHLAISTAPMATTRRWIRLTDSRGKRALLTLVSVVFVATVGAMALFTFLYRPKTPEAVSTSPSTAAPSVNPSTVAVAGSRFVPSTRSSGVDIMTLPPAVPDSPPVGPSRPPTNSPDTSRPALKPRPVVSSPAAQGSAQPPKAEPLPANPYTTPKAPSTVNLGF